MPTADAAKAKLILDASAEIDAAKAETKKLRERLVLNDDTLRNLQNANKALEVTSAEKDNLLNVEKEAIVAIWKELEQHIYEDAFINDDILRKFRMRSNFSF